MRVLIFAPNAGASLSTGGGTNFVLRQARALARDPRVHVTLAAFHAFDLETLSKYHNLDLTHGNIDLLTSNLRGPYLAFRRSPAKLSAYDALLLPGFNSWIRRTFQKVDPDWVWFHDDIPATLCERLGSVQTALYVHFPLAARNPGTCPVINGSRGLAEKLNEAVLSAYLPKIVCPNPSGHTSTIWANSRVTARAIRSVWNAQAHVVFPFESGPPRPTHTKTRTVLGLGSFSRGKNFESLIRGFSESKLTTQGWKLIIAGNSRDDRYLAYLRRLVSRLGLGDSTQLVIDVAGDLRDRLLFNASIIVHPAVFEPFGIALIEGMVNGAAAISYAGDWSGAWIDTLDSGRFGLGFTSSTQLSEQLTYLVSGNLESYQKRAVDRAATLQSASLESELALARQGFSHH